MFNQILHDYSWVYFVFAKKFAKYIPFTQTLEEKLTCYCFVDYFQTKVMQNISK